MQRRHEITRADVAPVIPIAATRSLAGDGAARDPVTKALVGGLDSYGESDHRGGMRRARSFRTGRVIGSTRGCRL